MISYENVILIIIATVLISAIISGMYYARRTHRKVSYILDALEDKETNFRFDENKLMYRKFNKTLNRIRLIFEKEKQEINEQERYYGQMLDRVKTGIVVVELNDKFSGKVSYCNSAALNILGVATLSNIRQLANVSKQRNACFFLQRKGADHACCFIFGNITSGKECKDYRNKRHKQRNVAQRRDVMEQAYPRPHSRNNEHRNSNSFAEPYTVYGSHFIRKWNYRQRGA